MPSKNKQHNKDVWNAWYARQSKEYKKNVAERSAERKIKLIEEFENYKKLHPCIKCNESETCCIDFHHLNGDDKEFNISELSRRGYSFNKIKKEIDKCVPLCSNCHRKLHKGILKL